MKRMAVAAALLAGSVCAASAEPIANPIAIFNGLDKITGITTTFEVRIGEQKRFGGLVVTPSVCNTRPVTEQPKTMAFVRVDELQADKSRKTIFSGWMYAENPGLNAVEHPIYDVWLNGCSDPNAPPPVIETPPDLSTLQDQIEEDEPED